MNGILEGREGEKMKKKEKKEKKKQKEEEMLVGWYYNIAACVRLSTDEVNCVDRDASHGSSVSNGI